MNVQSIHNATFASRLPAGYLQESRTLANYHEYGVFSDPSFSGIGNSMYAASGYGTILNEAQSLDARSFRL